MKATGMTRGLDKLGRIVIPRELRKSLDLVEEKDSLEFFVEGEKIILRKYAPGCVFCGGMKDLFSFGGQNVCGCCRNEIRNGLEKEKAAQSD